MKNCDYWKSFIQTGKIDDYLTYIACTREEYIEELMQVVDRDEEGGMNAGIDYRNGNGSVSNASW